MFLMGDGCRNPRSRRSNARSSGARPRSSFSSSSAIWTALVAAPLRRLSLTHQKSRALGRCRSWPDAAHEDVVAAARPRRAAGTAARRGRRRRSRPGRFDQSSRAASGVIGRSVSTRIDSLWQYRTGTRTQVGQTSIESSPMILRVSWTIFISSLV